MIHIEERLSRASKRLYGEVRHAHFVNAFKKVCQNWNLDSRRIVHVVGTNGKGTTSTALACFLTQSGFRVGLFTSPHLESIFERIRIGQEFISEMDFIASFEAIQSIADEYELVHFEILTLMALEYFRRQGVDYMVFEAGVGGRWDPTGALPHQWTALATVGFDHIEILGPNLSDITLHKIGAIEGGSQVAYLQPKLSMVRDEIESFRRRLVPVATWTEVSAPPARPAEHSDWPMWEVFWRGQWYPMSLVGEHAAANLTLAAELYQKMTGHEIEPRWFQAVVWPGRFEKISNLTGDWVLSGDHNAEGIEALNRVLRYYSKNWIALLGVSGQKSMSEFFSPLRHPFSEIHLCPSSFKPASSATLESASRVLKAQHPETPVLIWPSWTEGVLAAANSQKILGQTVLVSGSLYLVGNVRAMLSKADEMISGSSERPPSAAEGPILLM